MLFWQLEGAAVQIVDKRPADSRLELQPQERLWASDHPGLAECFSVVSGYVVFILGFWFRQGIFHAQDESFKMLMKLAPKKRRNPRNLYLGIAAVVLIAGFGRYFAFKAEQENEAQQALLVERLARLDATLPKQLDAITTLEYVGLMYSDTIIYRYRIDLEASSLSEERKVSMEAKIRLGLEQLACKEPQLLAMMRRFKIHQEHYYLARNSKLFTIDLRAEQLNCPE
ncbi:hypothetical protein ALP94_00537 [Pseudomonas savastanoi pv. glycinea]|nr:hypothetical protein ALP94_00537 [Pseudomonas savastanoi pv. glycinea]